MQLAIACADRIGITQDILDVLAHHKIDLRGIEVDAENLQIFISTVQVAFEELQAVMAEIRKVEGVEDVKTTSYLPMAHEHNELLSCFDHILEPILTIDAQGEILVANRAADDLFHLHNAPLKDTHRRHRQIHHHIPLPSLDHSSRRQLSGPVILKGNHYLIEISDARSDHSHATHLIRLLSPTQLTENLRASQVKTIDSHTLHAKSAVMRKVLKTLEAATRSEAALLISGETGTGKDQLARLSHDHGPRHGKPFLVLSCATLPDNVAESELFGYGPHAFTADDEVGKKGLLQMADGGTLFLDEIGGMSPALQVKLLRFLQDGTFRRVGDEKEIRVDVRIICSTQHDITAKIQSGDFREDLFYRLNVLSIHIPPLRERSSDILPLAQHFIRRFSHELGRRPPSMSENCEKLIMKYPWPGNVRQLKNTLLRAISLIDKDVIDSPDLSLPAYNDAFGYYDESFEGTLEEAVKQFENQLLRRLYPAYPSSRQLGKKLGLSHTAIANKLKEYGIGRSA